MNEAMVNFTKSVDDSVPSAVTSDDAIGNDEDTMYDNNANADDENEIEFLINNDNNILLGGTEMDDRETASKNEDCRFTKTVPSRKRIYGEEFRESNRLTVKPHFHDLKLDQPTFENVVNLQSNQVNDANSSGGNEIPIVNSHRRSLVHRPTNTKRSFIGYNIDNSKVPDICSKCYSIKCICNVLE